MNFPGMLWLLPALIVPLVLAALVMLPKVRKHSLSFLPIAPLPALVAALLAPEGTSLAAPGFLLGVQLALEGNGRLFLGFISFLWMAAGFFARAYMHEDSRRVAFAGFWCLTLAGNVGVFLADDVVSFYTAFACLSLAAYPLVVHTRNAPAMRAGLVYIVLALFGETCLLLGFMLGAADAETLRIEDVRNAIADSPRHATLLLLIAGFGIKAGLVPLHVWLPLAHPAAPTPASAVLSGAIVKAGIFGFMQFLPIGASGPEWQVLTIVGLFTAFFGVAIGLPQRNVKTILAYSTISQMGLVVAVLGAAMQGDSPQLALAAASLYALHHGLAKGALFMGVGVVAASGAKTAWPWLLVLALPALSLAGFPLTAGALAKLGAKPLFGEGATELLFTLSAVGTSLLMLRFMLAVSSATAQDPQARPALGLLLPWLASVVSSLAVLWLLFANTTGHPLSYPFAAENLWGALWPPIAAAIIAAVALAARVRAPHIPEGDLLAPTSFAAARIRSLPATVPMLSASFRLPERLLALVLGEWTLRAERLLSRWSLCGTLLLLLALLAAR